MPQKRCPDREKYPSGQRKPDDQSQKNPDAVIQPEQAAAGIDRKPRQNRQQQQAEEQIHPMGQPTAQAAQTPAEIIQHRRRDPQQDRLSEPQRLGCDRQLHQPKSRAKKPAASRPLSS